MRVLEIENRERERPGDMTFFCCLSDTSLASDARRWINSGSTKKQIKLTRMNRGALILPEQQLRSKSLASVETRMLGTISLMSLFTTAARDGG